MNSCSTSYRISLHVAEKEIYFLSGALVIVGSEFGLLSFFINAQDFLIFKA
jgi:hypothetical protein